MTDELRAAAIKIAHAAQSGDCPFNWGMVAQEYLTFTPDDDERDLQFDDWLSTVTTPCDDGMLLGRIHEMAI